MFNCKHYLTAWRKLNFLDKHSVANTWVSGILALAGLLLSLVVFKVTIELQHQANALQKQMFIREQNDRNAERVKETVRAFAIEGSRPDLPAPQK
jgi:uncharacterized iron-regulated membrane protein